MSQAAVARFESAPCAPLPGQRTFVFHKSGSARANAVEQLTAGAAPSNRVLRTRCGLGEQLCGYLPWRVLFADLLDGAVADRPQMQQISELVQRWAPARQHHLPLLAVVLGARIETPSRKMSAAERQTLRETLVVDLLTAVAGERPLLLVIEECQWIDPASLALLGALARCCDGETPLSISIVLSGSPAAELVLSPHLPQWSQWRRAAAGHPGALPDWDVELAPVQEQLSEVELTALRAASLLGPSVGAADLAAPLPFLGPMARVAETLERLCTLDLLHPVSGGGDSLRYRFAQPYLRELVAEATPPRLRGLLHVQVGRHLAQRLVDGAVGEWDERAFPQWALLGRLIHLFWHSDDCAVAARYLLRLATEAEAEGELALAFGAMELLVTRPAEKEQFAVRHLMGRVLLARGEPGAAKVHLERALVLAEQHQDQAHLAECELDLALVQQRLHQPDAACVWRRSAEQRCRQIEDAVRRTALLQRAALLAE